MEFFVSHVYDDPNVLTGRSITVVRKAGGLADGVQLPAARPIKTFT